MSRISGIFSSLAEKNGTALVPYITAGDPVPGATVELMHGLVEAGADIIELGVPFSDPMADGPVIQAACERALKHDVSLSNVLEMVTEFRSSNQDTPVVLMGYLNPIEIMGYELFAERATQAGVDGVLVVDIPPEEATEVVTLFHDKNIDTIFLAAPTTTAERLGLIASVSSGFLYYVSIKGVTGAASLDVGALTEKLDVIKQHTELPVGVGFGISTAEDAGAVAKVADAVVVGSALVKFIAEQPDDIKSIKASMQELLSSMRESINNAST